VKIETMEIECAALTDALAIWKLCPNLDDNGRRAVDAWVEVAKQSYDAGMKAMPEDPVVRDKTQHAIAITCRRATGSIQAATVRCNAGKPPPRNY
jgi:hypothetical protein